MSSRNIPITTRTPLYVWVAIPPIGGLLGAAEYLSQHHEQTAWLAALGLFALCSLLGVFGYIVTVARIKSWQDWALHNHGTYSRPDHNAPVVDELIGPNPSGAGEFVIRRMIHAPIMGQGANSSWVTVELSVRLDGGAETRIKSKYIWLRVPSPTTMVRYLVS